MNNLSANIRRRRHAEQLLRQGRLRFVCLHGIGVWCLLFFPVMLAVQYLRDPTLLRHGAGSLRLVLLFLLVCMAAGCMTGLVRWQTLKRTVGHR